MYKNVIVINYNANVIEFYNYFKVKLFNINKMFTFLIFQNYITITSSFQIL